MDAPTRDGDRTEIDATLTIRVWSCPHSPDHLCARLTEIRYPGLPEVTSSAVPGSDAVCVAVREWLQTLAADDL